MKATDISYNNEFVGQVVSASHAAAELENLLDYLESGNVGSTGYLLEVASQLFDAASDIWKEAMRLNDRFEADRLLRLE